ncbi:MAG TPA: patatin-like phospholipase family protein [Thermoanaerobaculia bacterium]|jgi:predicted acylesterase/phospholipase RssA|nr:patatin-like phospholipase family protein [Thermoanaerobaculia bacterium]
MASTFLGKVIGGLASAAWGWLRISLWLLAGMAASGMMAWPKRSLIWAAFVATVGGALLARRPFRIPRNANSGGRLLAELLGSFLILWAVLYTIDKMETGLSAWAFAGPLLLGAYWAADRTNRHVALDPVPQLSLEKVKTLEQRWVELRRRTVPGQLAPGHPPIGLALSGGGIRSASLSCGFVHELAHLGCLRHVDYLSTVSGGGWLGSLLTVSMISPEESHALVRGEEKAWQRVGDQLEKARGFLSLKGEGGAQRLGYILRRIGLGLLFNLFLLTLMLGLTVLLFMEMQILSIGEWSTLDRAGDLAAKILPSLVIESVAPERAEFLVGSNALQHIALLPGLVLLAGTLLSTGVGWAAAAIGWKASASALRGVASVLRPWAAVALFAGGVALGSVAITVLSIYLVLRALLAQFWWPPRAWLRPILALALAALPLSWAAGREHYTGMTRTWHRSTSRVMVAVINVVWRDSYLYLTRTGVGRIACQCTNDRDECHCTKNDKDECQCTNDKDERDRAKREEEQKVLRELGTRRVYMLVFAAPAFLLVFVAVGFWVQRDAVGLYEFWRREIARSFLGDSRGGVWPLADLGPSGAQGAVVAPLHILNGAANTPGSSDPRLRRLRASRFEMSPVAVGGPATGWVETSAYEGRLTLSHAAAISGAVVNSQGGRSIGAFWGLLLNLLNLRLGTWVRNPRWMSDERERSRPLFSPTYLLREWLGTNDETEPALFVSDGGHDDNLGLSALVERGCGLVVALDATFDPGANFTDLRRTLEILSPAWVVQGEKDGGTLPPHEVPGPGRRRTAPGATELRLRHRETGHICRIIYAKSALTERCLADEEVATYARENLRFPHDFTGDQWFEPEQLQAYVKVGRGIAADAAALFKVALHDLAES